MVIVQAGPEGVYVFKRLGYRVWVLSNEGIDWIELREGAPAPQPTTEALR